MCLLQRNKNYKFFNFKNGLTKQTSGIDSDDFLASGGLEDGTGLTVNEDEGYPGSPRPKSPDIVQMQLPFSQSRVLPWKPKVR